MHLYLDTTERDSFRVALIDKGAVLKDKTISSARTHSEKLLKAVNSLLGSCRQSIKDIEGIAVVKGPGSFTSLRVGVTTANALSFALGAPVVGVASAFLPTEAIHWPKIKKMSVVIPEYGSEPHITQKKRI